MLLLCRLQSQTCSRQCATLWLGCATCMHCCMLARPRRDTCKTGCHARALRSRHRESLSANAHEPQTGARIQHARDAPNGCFPFALLQRIIGCGRSRLTGRQGRRPGLLDPEANTPWGAEHDPRCLKRRALDVPTLCPGSPQGARVRVLDHSTGTFPLDHQAPPAATGPTSFPEGQGAEARGVCTGARALACTHAIPKTVVDSVARSTSVRML